MVGRTQWSGTILRVFAIYQILLGWKTYGYYYEADELPNPRLTQPKKNRLKVALGPLLQCHFFPQQFFFSLVGIGFI